MSGDGPAAVVPPRSPGAPRIPDAVRRVFAETFTVRDVAEPLASFDAETPAAEVRAFMEDRGFDAVGVRSKGHVVGFVRSDSLENGTCGQRLQPLDEATVLCDSAPLLTVLQALNQVEFVFVAVLGKVGGIITRSDLQKAPLRMWLFGVVTMIEMRFTDLIEQHCPADGWTALLSEARLQKRRDLQAECRPPPANGFAVRLPSVFRQGQDHRDPRGHSQPHGFRLATASRRGGQAPGTAP